MTAPSAWQVRQLRPGDLGAFRLLRLEALRAHPEAFGVTAEEEESDDTARLIAAPPGAALGAFASEALIGSAVLTVSPREKQRHKGHVVSVYVAPEWRGAGVGMALMDVLIAHARQTGLRSLTLSVTAGNDSARRLYRRFGFVTYGVEPDGLLAGGRLYDLDLMVLRLERHLA